VCAGGWGWGVDVHLSHFQSFFADYASMPMQEGGAPAHGAESEPSAGMPCVACLDELAVDQMAFLTCDHCICYVCFKGLVTAAVSACLCVCVCVSLRLCVSVCLRERERVCVCVC
jgi:hypothetical protein